MILFIYHSGKGYAIGTKMDPLLPEIHCKEASGTIWDDGMPLNHDYGDGYTAMQLSKLIEMKK